MTDEMLRVFLGRVIRQRRRALDLTIAELGDKSGIHFTQVGDIERGRRSFRLATLFAIAHALDLTATQVIERVEIAALIAGQENEDEQ